MNTEDERRNGARGMRVMVVIAVFVAAASALPVSAAIAKQCRCRAWSHQFDLH